MMLVARRALLQIAPAILALLCLASAAPRAATAGGDTATAQGAGGATDSNIKTRIQSYPVKAASGEIKVDGAVDDAGWSDAVEVTDFYEFRPGDGVPARVRTIVKIAYDNDHVYFMARCFDPEPQKIRAHLTDRDNCYSDDYIGVQLDTFLDRRTGYEFLVNPLGIQADLSLSNGGDENDSFDCLWTSAAHIDSLGWTAEFAIPTKSVRFRDVPVTEWGFWIFRNYPREARYQLASHKMNRDDPCWMCQYDQMTSLQNLASGKNLEVLPYITETGNRSRGRFGGPFKGNSEARVGLSLKYGLTPSMTFDGTVNTDFAQIEADASQLNVNNSSALYLNEKRPFFLEGSNIFGGQGNLFYSRAISDPDWATKITGRQGKLQVGALFARDPHLSMIVPYSGGSDQLDADVPSNDMVFRARADLLKDSSLGFLGTGRTYDKGHSFLGSFDGNIRVLPRVRWVWFAGMSKTKDRPELAADTLGGETNGFTTYQELNYSARHYNSSIWMTQRSPSFRADLGYLEYNNVIAFESWQEYDFTPNGKLVEAWHPALYLDYEENYKGQEREHVWKPEVYVRFKHQWEADISSAFRFIRFYNPDLGKELATQRQAYNFYMNKNGSGLVTGGISVRHAGDVNYGLAVLAHSRTYSGTVNVRPSTNLFVTLKGTFYDLRDKDVDTLYVKQTLGSLRMTYQFTPRLFVRLLSQAVNTTYPLQSTRKGLSNQFLLSYKLNYATVFFLGLNGDYRNRMLTEDGDHNETREGYTAASNGAFAKFQYFWRM